MLLDHGCVGRIVDFGSAKCVKDHSCSAPSFTATHIQAINSCWIWCVWCGVCVRECVDPLLFQRHSAGRHKSRRLTIHPTWCVLHSHQAGPLHAPPCSHTRSVDRTFGLRAKISGSLLSRRANGLSFFLVLSFSGPEVVRVVLLGRAIVCAN